jgi:hypothetical protein
MKLFGVRTTVNVIGSEAMPHKTAGRERAQVGRNAALTA